MVRISGSTGVLNSGSGPGSELKSAIIKTAKEMPRKLLLNAETARVLATDIKSVPPLKRAVKTASLAVPKDKLFQAAEGNS